MLNALLIGNKPHCPICGKRKYAVKDYKEVEHDLNKYTQITARCVCDTIFKYCEKVTVEKELYFVFDDEKEINEKEEKINSLP